MLELDLSTVEPCVSGPSRPQDRIMLKDLKTRFAEILGCAYDRDEEVARIHQSIKSNFLASPKLVVAYALAGLMDIDMTYEPVGLDPNGKPVYLEDIWPSHEDIADMVDKHVKKEFFELEYGRIFDGDEFWRDLPDVKSLTYEWDDRSTYIKNPPYFEGFKIEPDPVGDISAARALVLVGDTVTTDHISPAGAIPETYPAGKYLMAQGVEPAQFNSYGSRRGNHEVMMRGTLGNIRLKNPPLFLDNIFRTF